MREFLPTHSITKDGETLIAEVMPATGILQRMRGLLGYPRLGAGRGMYIAPCNAVHTFGMRFPLDLVFVDREMTVCRVTRRLPPNRMAAGGPRAAGVIEVEAGWLGLQLPSEGDRLALTQRLPRRRPE